MRKCGSKNRIAFPQPPGFKFLLWMKAGLQQGSILMGAKVHLETEVQIAFVTRQTDSSALHIHWVIEETKVML